MILLATAERTRIEIKIMVLVLGLGGFKGFLTIQNIS
jgi:hypothetical protein